MNCPTCRTAVPEAALEVRDVTVVLAPAPMEATGLLGWARLQVGPLVADGLAVRVTREDEIVISWPRRRAESGTLHRTAYITDADLRRRVEAAVIVAYVEARRRAGRAT